MFSLCRKSLDVTNLIEDLEGRHPTVVGWGYTSGFDPWSGEAQVGARLLIMST
jgi:hypothetical protein